MSYGSRDVKMLLHKLHLGKDILLQYELRRGAWLEAKSQEPGVRSAPLLRSSLSPFSSHARP